MVQFWVENPSGVIAIPGMLGLVRPYRELVSPTPNWEFAEMAWAKVAFSRSRFMSAT